MLKKTLSMAAFCLCMLGAKAGVANYNVVPLPQTVNLVKGKGFVLNPQTVIVCAGTDQAMKDNANFLAEYIQNLTGLKLPVVSAKSKTTNAIVLSLDSKVNGKEAYTLVVNNKQVRISGSTAAGVFYGIQTLRKSLPVMTNSTNANASTAQTLLPAVNISDAPLFGYRGVMLDCCRHFFPVSFVKKFIDILALHNINTFHWHLSEDQGWRIEIKKYPKLTEIGSMRSGTVIGHNSTVDDNTPHGGYYTQEQAKEIVAYAAQRHITVIPEIDLPGHTRALLAAYPEMGCTGGPYTVGHNWGVYHDVLCLGNEKVYGFVQDIIGELCDIFPAPYFHIGGDEAPTTRWKECPRCKALSQSTGVSTEQLQGVFTNRIEKFVNSKGKSIIGWDEILHGKINPSAVIMSWTGVNPGLKAASTGHDVIMTPGEFAYFDHYQIENHSSEPDAIGGLLPVEKVYSFNPLPDSVSVEARKHIIGVQANLWTEYIPYQTQVEYMLLPRLAALSEVQWVPAKNKKYDEFHKRATQLSKLYDRYGYTYALHMWPERYQHNRSDW